MSKLKEMIKLRLIIGVLVFAGACSAELTLPAVFSDGMVLQRNHQVPVWGWADAGSTVTVEFAGQTKQVVVSTNGEWQVMLDPMPASFESRTLLISSTIGPKRSADNFLEKNSDETAVYQKLKIGNVLVGEVWLCSGQSNMQMSMKNVIGIGEEKKRADRPSLRIFRSELNESLELQADNSGDWLICSPDTLELFAATAYFFGAEIHEELDVPVGLIRAAWGGSHIETWIPVEAQKKFPSVMAHKQQEDWNQSQGVANAQSWKYYPGKLYNGMVHPLVPYGLRGLIWYQGEGNAHTVHDAVLYRKQLSCLAEEWRSAWGHEFPVYAAQLPNYTAKTTETDAWAYVRESILNFRKDVPNAGVAITIDSGDPDDIHPRNKRPVGYRLARQALVYTYGKKMVAGGPLYRSMKNEGERIVVEFDDIGSGLMVKDSLELKTFTIAGKDRKFVPADAVVEGDTVVIRSPRVKDPEAVRYAWANNPEGCNLFNAEGFPASPFRTDVWSPFVETGDCTASALDSYAGREPVYAVNGAGLYLNAHTSAHPAGIMWMSANGSLPKWFKIDLTQSFNLDYMKIYNFNWAGYTSRGCRNVQIYYSNATSDPGNPVDDPDNWTAAGSAFDLTRAPGDDTYGTTHPTQPDTVDLSVTARWVAIRINSTFGGGYGGLSEVRF